MENKEENKVFVLPNNRTVIYKAVAPNVFDWEPQDYEAPIILTAKEKNKVLALNYDLDKVLAVKKGLVQKMRPIDIENEFKVSKSSIYKYKEILCGKDIEKLIKDRQNTEKVKNVFPIYLIFMSLGAENTNAPVWLIIPLFLIVVWLWLIRFWNSQEQLRRRHKECISKERDQFKKVFDLSYSQKPIVCNCKKEADNWTKILKFYNNSGRMVHVIERGFHQNGIAHWMEKEYFSESYCTNNAHRIIEGEKNGEEEWEKLEQLGFLDYFYWSRKDRPMFEISKKYIFNSIEFYSKNIELPTEDKAKSKKIVELMPKN